MDLVVPVFEVDVGTVPVVPVLLNPAETPETSKAHERMPDVSLVEESKNLEMNVSPQIAAFREGHEPENEW